MRKGGGTAKRAVEYKKNPVAMRRAEIAKIPLRVAAVPAGLRSRLTIEDEHAVLQVARCRRRGESTGRASSFDFALVMFLY